MNKISIDTTLGKIEEVLNDISRLPPDVVSEFKAELTLLSENLNLLENKIDKCIEITNIPE